MSDRGAARGATIWLTGLPASGKSSLAEAVEQRLRAADRPVVWIDGDDLRKGLCSDLGFSKADRAENVRRAGELALVLARADIVAIVSLISPYAAARAGVRSRHEEAGADFTEVWMSASAEVCEGRDPKGMWARARRGELPGFTGVDDPYEAPATPHLMVGPELSLEEAADRVLERL